jgi:predicted nucleic acid-binding protein
MRTLWTAEASDPIPITRSVAAQFARLVTTMKKHEKAKLRPHDAWIAATALAHGAELWTQDSDFECVPEPRVVRL